MANNTSCLVSTINAASWEAGAVPLQMQGIPRTVSSDDYPGVFDKWNTDGRRKVSTLNSAVAQAICSLTRGKSGDVALIRIGSNQFAAEHTGSGGDTSVVVCNTKGNIRGALIKSTGKHRQYPSLPESAADLAPVFAVYLGLITETEMLSDEDVVQRAKDSMAKIAGAENLEDVTEEVHYLNDMLIAGFEQGLIPCKITAGNMDILTAEQIELNYGKGSVICGSPTVIARENAGGGPGAVTAAEARGMFRAYASAKTWTEDEEKLIPSFPDDYPVMPETLEIARYFVESGSNRNIRRPMRNFLWRGITSYGKSTGVEMLAHILHTPLLRLTCSSGMEAQDLLSQFIPDSGADEGRDLPTFDDIMYDPESAYEAMTGEYREGVSCQEAMEEYGKACAARRGDGSARFRLVESNYVRALKNGYICEIQEISRIRDPGTLVSLNEYDRAGARIPLADGSFTERDPDAVVVYTDNVGYASCRQVDPSVMRRMDTVIDSYELTDEQVRGRVRYNTGFDDDSRLASMMKVWRSVIDYCSANEITEGEVSVNELERWVAVYMIDGPEGYTEGCRRCVVSKASADRTTQEEIWTQAALPLLEAE